MPSSARLKKVSRTATLLAFLLAPPALAQEPPAQGFFTTSDNVRIHYLEAGQGETLLFIPGWIMPAEIWEAQIRELSKYYHVVAMDPRSQGDSDITPLGNNPLRRSMDVDQLLDHLQVHSVVLVGWSLGAFDALAYLRQFGTKRVKALVLVDSPLAASSGPTPAATPVRSPFLQRFQADPAEAGRDYIWSLFKQPPPLPFYRRLTQAAARVPADIALSALDNTHPGDAWQPGLRILRRIPLLYAITPTYAKQAEWLLQADPRARVEVFENCGHALFVDQAERFNSLIRDFLAQASLYPPGLTEPRRKSAPPQIQSPQAAASPVSAAPASTPAEIPTSIPITPLLPEPTSTPTSTTVPAATSTPAFTATPVVPAGTPTFPPSNLSTFTPVSAETPTPRPAKIKGFKHSHFPTFTPVSTSTPAGFLHFLPSYLHTFVPAPAFTPTPTPPPAVSAHGSKAKTPAIHSRFFTTSDHVKLHYLEGGRGLPIVFIPGWIMPAGVWKYQLEDLVRDYHVVALDPRSQGESEMTREGDVPLRQARDIQELLDHLKLDSVVLVGWSHGAFHVLAYMGEFGTDRLYAAVLVDSSLGAASSVPAGTPGEARFLAEFKADRPKAVRGFVWGLFKKPPPTDFFREIAGQAARTPTDIALALLNNVFPGDAWQPGIGVIRQVPLLYAVTPKFTFQARYLAQADPQARIEFFGDAGHALFVDDAGRFNAVLRDFLGRSALYPAGLPEHRRKRPERP